MRLTLLVAAALSLSACTVLPKPEQKVRYDDNGKSAIPAPINSYSTQLAQQLVANSQIDLSQTHVGVTDFVGVESPYQQASILAQAMSEQLRGELASREVPIIDYKTTDFIRVTPKGDFALTRDYLEVDEIMPITHVVVGTYSYYRDGILANARLVDINSRHVVSTGSIYIPRVDAARLNSSEGQPIIR